MTLLKWFQKRRKAEGGSGVGNDGADPSAAAAAAASDEAHRGSSSNNNNNNISSSNNNNNNTDNNNNSANKLCEKEMWTSRWAQIVVAPVILLCLGVVLVSLLWYWTRVKLVQERSRVLEDVHSGAMTALGQSVASFMSILSIYSHAIETCDLFPFQTTETMFGPMLQQANFSQGTCVYFSRVQTLAERMRLEIALSKYANRDVQFREGYNFSVLPTTQSEYWVLSHGDQGLVSLALGVDYSSVGIIMEQIFSAINQNGPYVSQPNLAATQDDTLFLLTDASYKCDAILYENQDSEYDPSQVKGRGYSSQCQARLTGPEMRKTLATGAVTCTTLVKSFFSSPAFIDSSTCFEVTDVETQVVLRRSTNPACKNFDNTSSPTDPLTSVFRDHGRDWRMVHYSLPVELQQEDIAMLAGYASLFVAIAAGVSLLLFLRERKRSLDLRVEHSKRESLRVFLDTTSHDMRSPLQASMNLVHLIIAEQQDAIGPGGIEDLQTLQHTLHLLEDIVSNVLDFQKIESGTVQYGAEKNVDILSELRNLLQIISHGAAVKSQCRFAYKVSLKNNARVTCDRARICRAVMNVVSNAIKFTQVGMVDIVASVLSANSEVMQLHVVVQDTGPGISEEMLPRLFLPYEGAGINDGGGSGLGMFITKAIVDHYNGNIFVTSKLNEGSCFTMLFQIPVTPRSESIPLALDGSEGDDESAESSCGLNNNNSSSSVSSSSISCTAAKEDGERERSDEKAGVNEGDEEEEERGDRKKSRKHKKKRTATTTSSGGGGGGGGHRRKHHNGKGSSSSTHRQEYSQQSSSFSPQGEGGGDVIIPMPISINGNNNNTSWNPAGPSNDNNGSSSSSRKKIPPSGDVDLERGEGGNGDRGGFEMTLLSGNNKSKTTASPSASPVPEYSKARRQLVLQSVEEGGVLQQQQQDPTIGNSSFSIPVSPSSPTFNRSNSGENAGRGGGEVSSPRHWQVQKGEDGETTTYSFQQRSPVKATMSSTFRPQCGFYNNNLPPSNASSAFATPVFGRSPITAASTPPTAPFSATISHPFENVRLNNIAEGSDNNNNNNNGDGSYYPSSTTASNNSGSNVVNNNNNNNSSHSTNENSTPVAATVTATYTTVSPVSTIYVPHHPQMTAMTNLDDAGAPSPAPSLLLQSPIPAQPPNGVSSAAAAATTFSSAASMKPPLPKKGSANYVQPSKKGSEEGTITTRKSDTLPRLDLINNPYHLHPVQQSSPIDIPQFSLDDDDLQSMEARRAAAMSVVSMILPHPITSSSSYTGVLQQQQQQQQASSISGFETSRDGVEAQNPPLQVWTTTATTTTPMPQDIVVEYGNPTAVYGLQDQQQQQQQYQHTFAGAGAVESFASPSWSTISAAMNNNNNNGGAVDAHPILSPSFRMYTAESANQLQMQPSLFIDQDGVPLYVFSPNPNDVAAVSVSELQQQQQQLQDAPQVFQQSSVTTTSSTPAALTPGTTRVTPSAQENEYLRWDSHVGGSGSQSVKDDSKGAGGGRGGASGGASSSSLPASPSVYAPASNQQQQQSNNNNFPLPMYQQQQQQQHTGEEVFQNPLPSSTPKHHNHHHHSNNQAAVSPASSTGAGVGTLDGAVTTTPAKNDQSQQQNHHPRRPSHPHRSRPKVVLFAEDNITNLKTGIRILKSFGADVISAKDGEEAWRLSEQHYSEVDVFILDVNMPGICGDVVARRIRELEARLATSKPKPVFALTGHAEHKILADLLEAGFTEVVTKPATPLGIKKLLYR